MSDYKSVYWYSGLYLQPQHFQINELNREYWQGRSLSLMMPFSWGVISLILNRAALSNEVLSADNAVFLFADGSFVDSAINGLLSPRSLRDAWVTREKPLRIYVGLRKFTHNQSNVTGIVDANKIDDAATRWVSYSSGERVRDAYGNGPEAEVQQLTYNLQFFLENEIADATGYSLIPIGQLHSGNDGVTLDKAYFPPSINLYATPMLGQRIDELRHDLTGRIYQLEELKRPEALEGELHTQEKSTLLLTLRTLSRYVVQLHHYCDARTVHPWQIFGLLRQLISELSCFTDRCSFLGEWDKQNGILAAYDHLDIAQSFDSACQTIYTLLNALILEPNTVITLEPKGVGYYSAVFYEHGILESQRVYLVLRSDSFIEKARVMPDNRLIKMASADQINNMVNRALPGVNIYYQEVAPLGLPNRTNTRYFRLDNHGALWHRIEETESVAVHWADAPEGLQVEIIILRAS